MINRARVRFPVESIDFAKLFAGSNQLTIASWEDRWIHNLHFNRKLIDDRDITYKSAVDLLHIPQYHKVVVCGAGPSLGRQARYLRDIPPDWGIVCADHAVHAVLDQGCKPTLVISMDGDQTDDPYIQEGMRRLRYGYPDVPTLLDVVSCTTITAQVANPYWFRTVTSPEARVVQFVRDLFPNITTIGHGGNVGSVTLIMAAFFLFAKHVIIIGMDSSLAPGLGRKLYYHDQVAADTHQYVDVHDIYGRNVQTIGNLHNYKIWLDHFTYMNNHIEWINANDGGYLSVNSAVDVFEHYRYMPLKNAIEYLKAHGPDD
jgi:hypothetical protein